MSTTSSQQRHIGAPWLVLLLTLAALAAITVAATAAAADDGCDDELHRITAGSPVHADDAAVLTAQAFAADTDGFALASWDVADDVTLTAVQAVTSEGDLLLLPATDTGTVERVLELRFCGSRGSATDGQTRATDGPAVTVDASSTTAATTADDAEVLGVQLLASPERVAATEAAAGRTRALEIAAAVGALLAIGLATTRGRVAATVRGRR